MFSELFVGGRALWRLVVANRRNWNSSSSRRMNVGVNLQHCPAEIENIRLKTDYTLTVLGKQFRDKKDLKNNDNWFWTVVEDLDTSQLDADLVIILHIIISKQS